jgi:UDP-N-acetylmuramoylalanine--D-glutamate ligase
VSGGFEGERAVVVGAAVAGTAAARALAEEGASVRVTEARPASEIGSLDELSSLGVEVFAGGHGPEHLDGATLVVASPGVPPAAQVLAWAKDRGIPVWGEMELGARLCRAPYVAVTGTNGKTTTTGMIASCLRAAGIDAVACGNIGYPFVTAAREEHSALVVECSSFQLDLQESLHPRVSALLNLAPDHLDWHGSEAAYFESKAKIFANQTGDDVHVGNRDDAPAAEVSARAGCATAWFRLGAPGDGEVGFEADVLTSKLGGDAQLGVVDATRAGYRADAAAAATISLSFGASAPAVAEGLARFEPDEHRGDVVGTLGGVRFIDNSKATNVHAALAAIDAVGRCVLIAGGLSKGVDLSPLRSRAPSLIAVIAIGEAADEVARVFDGATRVKMAGSIEEAVPLAYGFAEPASAVLLAPACASWDQFRDYVERGERFAAAVSALESEGVAGG